MARLSRRSVVVSGGVSRYGALTSSQELCLVAGVEFSHERTFRSPEEYADAWRQHRNSLVFSVGLFRRPEAYWFLEVGEAPPPDEKEAILRLGLPLSRAERAELDRCARIEQDAAVLHPSTKPDSGITEADELPSAGGVVLYPDAKSGAVRIDLGDVDVDLWEDE